MFPYLSDAKMIIVFTCSSKFLSEHSDYRSEAHLGLEMQLQRAECLVSTCEVLSLIPNTMETTVAHIHNHVGEMELGISRVQSHPCLHSEEKATLGYTRLQGKNSFIALIVYLFSSYCYPLSNKV